MPEEVKLIDDIPDLKDYPVIHGAYKNHKLIIFIGAGVSAIWGCKTWHDMATSIIEECYDKYKKINYWQRENLLREYGAYPRKLITIAKELLGEDFYKSLSETVKPLPLKKDKYQKLYQNICVLNSIFITTNIDNHLSGLFPKSNVHLKIDEFDASLLKPRELFYLHGLIDDDHKENMVLAIDDYIARYKEPKFKEFLQTVFLNPEYCLLFIGYGLEELEIIEYMAEKFPEETKKRSPIDKYYVLRPFFRHEFELFQHESLYFQKINVSVIPYSISGIGYEQLYNVITKWSRDLLALEEKSETSEFYKNIQLIDKNL